MTPDPKLVTMPGNGRDVQRDKATMEHVVPLSRAGTHTWDNVALACWQCNVYKNATPLEGWLDARSTA